MRWRAGVVPVSSQMESHIHRAMFRSFEAASPSVKVVTHLLVVEQTPVSDGISRGRS